MDESAALDATDGPMEPETPCSWILDEYATTNHNIRTEKKITLPADRAAGATTSLVPMDPETPVF